MRFTDDFRIAFEKLLNKNFELFAQNCIKFALGAENTYKQVTLANLLGSHQISANTAINIISNLKDHSFNQKVELTLSQDSSCDF